jgi:hypothetical protein
MKRADITVLSIGLLSIALITSILAGVPVFGDNNCDKIMVRTVMIAKRIRNQIPR